MTMEKYKVCPVCGLHNNPLMLECNDCETDLQNVLVVDESMERVAEQDNEETATPSPAPPMVRVCDCGTKNPVQVRCCSACGEDISMIVPTPDCASTVQRYMLSSLDGTFVYEINEGTTIIGRENEMREYLSSKLYVSRKHAALELNLAAGILTIKNCNTTNYTFVNNTLISGDVAVELKDGDEVGMGGNEQNGSRQSEAAYFLVRIGSCI